MRLPLHPPILPMEALSVDEIPVGPEWQYEPKWDGFRCTAFRDGESVELQSKSGQPLARYFPEMVAAVAALPIERCILDGELVIPTNGAFSFDVLLQRIHPAASRVSKLADESPAMFIAFDLLADDAGSLLDLPLAQRRKRLEAFASRAFTGAERIRLSPATTKIADAQGWLKRVGATLDGIIAKRLDLPYGPGQRDAMQKIKNYRSADCVVGGFRYATAKPVVGSLLLGLYNDEGLLDHVGFTSGIAVGERAALTKKLEALVAPPGFTGKSPGGPSRWSTKRSSEWPPLKPRLVVEVSYDHFSGDRFRHGTRILRWRPDKEPRQCSLDQVHQKKATLMRLLASK